MELEQRLGNLELEIKLLKGEIKQTLVDLRAIVMKSDSPINEHFIDRFTRHAAESAPYPVAPVNMPPVSAVQQVNRVETSPVVERVTTGTPQAVGPTAYVPQQQPVFLPPDTGHGPAPVQGMRDGHQESQWEEVHDGSGQRNGHSSTSAAPEQPAVRINKTRHWQEILNARTKTNGSVKGASNMNTATQVIDRAMRAEQALNLSVNDVSNLVRWVSVAKRRMGQEKMRGLLDLYIKYAGYTPALKEVVTEISELLGDMAPAQGEPERAIASAEECTDLMYQFHGIINRNDAVPGFSNMDEEGHY